MCFQKCAYRSCKASTLLAESLLLSRPLLGPLRDLAGSCSAAGSPNQSHSSYVLMLRHHQPLQTPVSSQLLLGITGTPSPFLGNLRVLVGTVLLDAPSHSQNLLCITSTVLTSPLLGLLRVLLGVIHCIRY